MKKLFILISLSFLMIGANNQEWETTFEIEQKERYFLLKGQIDGQYDITMHLEGGGMCQRPGLAINFSNRILKGWYYYDKIKTKIPLIGYHNPGFHHQPYGTSEKRYPLELYVPPNYSMDTINQSTCKVSGFMEKFYGKGLEYFIAMNWSKDDKGYPVDLEVVHDYSLETKVYLKTNFNREKTKINISELTELKYIEKIELIGAKQIKDDYHITFVFHERSRPGSLGGGHCGAGIERYLGYLKLGKESNISKFDFKLNHSCFNNISEPYKVEKGNPECGIMKKQD